MAEPIAIIGGTGAEGMGLARRWARAGLSVILGSRDAARAHAAALEIAAASSPISSISGMENAQAVAASEIVVLTVPFTAHATTLKKLKPAFRSGHILIDATVPLAASIGGSATRVLGVWQGSAAQQAAELVPEGVAVAAAFHNVAAGLLAGEAPVDCDVIICSDSELARHAAAALTEKIPGLRAINGGKLENARTVEQLTALLVAINLRYKVHSAGLRLTGLPVPPPQL